MGRQNFGNKAHDKPKEAVDEVVDKAAGKDRKKEEQEEKSDLKQQAAMKKEERKNCRTIWTERSTGGCIPWKPTGRCKTLTACGR